MPTPPGSNTTSLGYVQEVSRRRPLPQLGIDRPQFQQQKRYAREADRNVQTLSEAVQHHRPRREGESPLRMLGEVACEAGEEGDVRQLPSNVPIRAVEAIDRTGSGRIPPAADPDAEIGGTAAVS